MILKPPEESIHSWENLAPVPESFRSHCYILYPGFTPGLVSQEELAGQFLAGTDEVRDEGGLLLLSFDEQLL